ncbi:ISEfa8, transposase [Planococcus antarcticus DSM 14505]|uniref:ISEfa8, transposase n=1 Tax=Planococcus antarcticus DSM 14505 TaxID=1185653 RepID=A0AA87IQ53_9BACL|nr:transposase [Planococcus antarcticus]EIM08257.1 ISEfa8, transposase [Planococcus antarcticus DSM 14505]
MTQKRRAFSAKFKKQVVALHAGGKSLADIVREYDLTASALDRWIAQSNQTGSFEEKDNRSPLEAELLVYKKRNKQLEMEVDM